MLKLDLLRCEMLTLTSGPLQDEAKMVFKIFHKVTVYKLKLIVMKL